MGKNIIKRVLLLLSCCFLMISCLEGESMGLDNGLYAKIDTNRGEILLSLEYEKTPLTVTNFVGLAEGTVGPTKGKGFYDGLKFHRVLDKFMIQGGCPLGTGTGGPGYSFPDEFDAELVHSGPGILSMANSGPNTNGSQFFITHVETPWLDGKHSVFGHVVDGMDIVNAVEQEDKIHKIEIIRVGKDAEAFKADQDSFDKLVAAASEEQKEAEQEKNKEVFAVIEEKWPNYKTTDSGLMYLVKTKGSGESPSVGTKVKVHYTGFFLNGKVFDSSVQRGTPFEFKIGAHRVIPGWEEAVALMQKGEKTAFILPPALAYGDRGAGGVIPPGAYIAFDIELLDF